MSDLETRVDLIRHRAITRYWEDDEFRQRVDRAMQLLLIFGDWSPAEKYAARYGAIMAVQVQDIDAGLEGEQR